MQSGLLFDIKKYAIHDGPGIRTTLFFKGCPLNCLWCHNPESQSPLAELAWYARRCIGCRACQPACPQAAIAWSDGPRTDPARCTTCGACAAACYAEARQRLGWEISVEQAMAEIERDVAFYDESGGGATFSGGEPLLQADFLLALLRACRERAIHTVVDTCGFAAWGNLERIYPYTDLFLYDLKLMDEARHVHFTGVSNRPILANLQALSQRGANIILRLPLLPGVNDDPANIQQLGAFVANLPARHRLEVLPYHAIGVDKYARLGRHYARPDLRPPSAPELARVAQALLRWGVNVVSE